MKIQIVIGISGLLLAACGCASRAMYVEPGEIISGTPGKATLSELELSAQRLMERMLVHPQFSANYNAVKAEKGGKLPIAVIGDIENRTTERIQGRLDAIGDTVRASLFDSALFEVKDDRAFGAILSRILRGGDDPLEDGSLVQFAKTHEMPDFIVIGDFRRFADAGGYYTYRLRLAIHNLKTGKIVWEGIQTQVKL